jgi:hypothetical protein
MDAIDPSLVNLGDQLMSMQRRVMAQIGTVYDQTDAPASCGKFAEISRDLYKKYIHRCLDYFLRDNSNGFPRTSCCQPGLRNGLGPDWI